MNALISFGFFVAAAAFASAFGTWAERTFWFRNNGFPEASTATGKVILFFGLTLLCAASGAFFLFKGTSP